MTKSLTKSVKPFRSYFNIYDLTFSFDLNPWNQRSPNFTFYSVCCNQYMVKILMKSVKTFRSYCKIQDMKFSCDLIYPHQYLSNEPSLKCLRPPYTLTEVIASDRKVRK